MTDPLAPPRLSTSRMVGYAFGEGARVITVNGLSSFGLLYYTHALGLSASYAGLALSLSILLNSFTDPIMGHLTDNTRSRWGKRLSYIVGGGLLASASFWALWLVPRTGLSHHLLAVWVLGSNLLLQLGLTIFSVPYTALGFEICPSYEDRSRLQGIRAAFGMAVNFLFGGLAWSLFFRDRIAADGSHIEGLTQPSNYVAMGATLGLAAFLMVILCAVATAWSAGDTRLSSVSGNSFRAFRSDLKSILCDRLAWYVLGFSFLLQLGVLAVMQSQVFTYAYFMELSADAKTVMHGIGIVAYSGAALYQARLIRRTDKNFTAILGLALAVAGGLLLEGIFFGFDVDPHASWVILGTGIPVGLGLFGLGQMVWWAGIGILSPLAYSMMADISEINFLRHGVRKDGSYAAAFTFVQKIGISVGMFFATWMICAAGIIPGADDQTPAAIRSVTMLTFLAGPAFLFASFFVLWRYPVNRAFLASLRAAKSAN